MLAGCMGAANDGNEDVDKAVGAYSTVVMHLEAGIEDFDEGVDYFDEREYSSAEASFKVARREFEKADEMWPDFREAAVEAGINESEWNRFLDTNSTVMRYDMAANSYIGLAERNSDGDNPGPGANTADQHRIRAEGSTYPTVEEVEKTLSSG